MDRPPAPANIGPFPKVRPNGRGARPVARLSALPPLPDKDSREGGRAERPQETLVHMSPVLTHLAAASSPKSSRETLTSSPKRKGEVIWPTTNSRLDPCPV